MYGGRGIAELDGRGESGIVGPWGNDKCVLGDVCSAAWQAAMISEFVAAGFTDTSAFFEQLEEVYEKVFGS